MTAREVAIIRRLKKVVKLPVATIAKGVDRHKKTVYAALEKSWKPSLAGRPQQLLEKELKHIIMIMKKLIKSAGAQNEISLAVIKRRSKCKFSLRTIHRALRKKGIKFRKMRSKPILTKADIKDRFEFAKKYRSKTRAWWLKNIHMHIDNKVFSCYVNAKARAYAAMRSVRGAYRLPSQGLDDGYVVVNKSMRYNPGVRSAIVSAGVGKGRVLMWDVLQQKKWTGASAAKMYAGPLKAACSAAWPHKCKFNVLEDNDPTGYKSKKGIAAKIANGIKAFELPKRSPDLSVCDYAIWKEVNKKMRRQEKKFSKSKRETRDDFLKRLRRAALSLPQTFIDKSIGNMVERCRRLYESKGKYFEEGGASKVW